MKTILVPIELLFTKKKKELFKLKIIQSNIIE